MEGNENNAEFGEISQMMFRIMPIFLQRHPYNIEWIHYIHNLVRNIGDQPEVNPYFTEDQWQQFKREMDIIIATLPPRMI